MRNHKTLLINTIAVLGLLFASNLLVACSSDGENNAIIEETEGGMELIQREFGECDGPIEDDNILQYVQARPTSTVGRLGKQFNLEKQYPHNFTSLGQMFPERGSWRQTKAEIMDLVDRHIWSPEKNRGVKLLSYFDMVLLINVSPRDSSTDAKNSAQTMQVLVRNDSSNDINTWERLKTWQISSGIPCLDPKIEKRFQKIATYTGVFKFNPDRLHRTYQSKQFKNADMYETMFLYHQYRNGANTGVAIHGTYKTSHLGRRDSGGCVRLYKDNAQCLYETIKGYASTKCLGGGRINYMGTVPSLLPTNGEADPEFDTTTGVEMAGVKVLVVIINDKNDLL